MTNLNDEKLKMMEDEMNRFEAEIALPVLPPPPPPPPPNLPASGPPSRPVIGSNTYNQVQRRLEEQQTGIPSDYGGGGPMGFQPGIMPPVGFAGIPPPPPPPPPPLMIPHQVQRVPPARPGDTAIPRTSAPPMMPTPPPPPPPPFLRGPPPPLRPVTPAVPPTTGFLGSAPLPPPLEPSALVPPTPLMAGVTGIPVPPQPAPTVLSATPKIYTAKPSTKTPAEVSFAKSLEEEAEKKKKMKKNNEKETDAMALWGAREMAERVRASTITTTIGPDPVPTNPVPSRKKDKKPKKHIRMAGGQTWEDPSLTEWDEDDFRIFCGDLGNDVTDEILTRAFSKYSSFVKAKVVRDKRTNKTKGFGFVSFKDPQDFIKAMKEMNGRYVGSRPIKLRKSTWKARNLETVRRKEKEKIALIGLLTGR